MSIPKGVLTCAKWLLFCLDIGWKKSDLDTLEALWWRYHTSDGVLKEKDKLFWWKSGYRFALARLRDIV